MTKKRTSDDLEPRAYDVLEEEELQDDSSEPPHGTGMPEGDGRAATLAVDRQRALEEGDRARRRETEGSLGGVGYGALSQPENQKS